jgi:hypothetical protein
VSGGGPSAKLIALALRLDACLLEPRTPDDPLLRELRAPRPCPGPAASRKR